MSLSMKIFVLGMFAFYTNFPKVHCHSWLACTDYTEKNGATWNPNYCRGFPRGGHRKAPKNGVFGGDSGFDHSPSEQNPCQVSKNDNGEYTNDHPMAVYYRGQQVVLVHPMKNHGADIGCTNIHIPDTGSWIYRSERNPVKDPTLSEFKRNLVFDLGKSPTGKDFQSDHSLSQVYPKPGYQNAPKFCENTDKAMGTFSFNIPEKLTPGKYTFIWLWAFNSANNLYSSCFEVEVVRKKSTRDRMLKANGFRDYSEPCGGMTSNPEIKGNTNPGCTDTPSFNYAQLPAQESSVATTEIPWYFRKDTTKTTTTASYRNWNWFTTRASNNNRNNRRLPTTTTRRPRRTTTTTTTPSTTTAPAYEYYYGDDYYSYYDTDNSNYGGSENYEYYYYEEENQQGQSNEKKVQIATVDSDISLQMMVLQFGGDIPIPAPRSTAVRRHYTIDFGCDTQSATFWNSKVTNEGEIAAPNSPRRHYEVMQEGDGELNKLYIYYHVNFKEPCDIARYPPRAKIVREEYENV